jgi:uncharacterized protein GlcG (DUF336 family)
LIAVTRQSLTLESAFRLLAAAEAKANEIGIPMVIAVVDESGHLKAFSKMDGAGFLSIQVAQDKAYTAVGSGIPSQAWTEYFANDKPLWDNLHTVQRAVPYAGGIPIRYKGQVIAAIGVAGGHYSQDQVVAEAALAALGEH